MVYGQQHFQGVSVISSVILNNFLEVYGSTKALTRGMEPIGKYQLVCIISPLRQNRDKGMSFAEFVTLVITGNIKFLM